jgi:hypothetical protein
MRELTEGEKDIIERFDMGLQFVWLKEHQAERETAVRVLHSLLSETNSFGWRLAQVIQNKTKEEPHDG